MKNIQKIEEGQKITGTVYKVDRNEVIVDIGYSTEGTIQLSHLTRLDVDSAEELISEGDEIEAIVSKIDEDDEYVLLSRLEIEQDEMFEALQNKFENDETVEVKVLQEVKGGLKCRLYGFNVFMPKSEVSNEYTEDFKPYVGKTLPAKIVEIGRPKGRITIVVSHKAIEKEKEEARKQEELEKIKEGEVLEGTVSKLMSYGAFIRFEQVEGLLHISEISHHRLKYPSEKLEEGQKVKVKVIGEDGDKRSLSMRALEPTPWEQFAETHSEGDKVTAKVVKKMDFGMILEVAPGVTGLLHKSNYSWNPRYNLAGDVEVGDTFEVQILSIDTESRKMRLSKKHLEYNPWEDVNVEIGEEVAGEVKELQPQGALVEVQGVFAFLPISEIQEEHVEKVSDVLSEGDLINAIVLKFNRERWQMVISKQAYEKKRIEDEYKKHLKGDDKESESQTLGELFADKLKDFQK